VRIPLSKIQIGQNVFEIDWPAGVLDPDKGGEGLRTIDRIKGWITLEPLSEPVDKADFLVKGRIETKVEEDCDRCLEKICRALDLEFKVILVQNLEEESLEKELKGEELNYSLLDGGEVDLQRVVLEQMILDSDMVRLCSPECQGLCPSCGRNLNLDRCDCKNHKIDLRLAALADWGPAKN
jgi:uncharacterized metal-binding protein YceD (DUF177 family)